MYDAVVGLMAFCYAWMCIQWGSWKQDEYLYFTEKLDIYKGYFIFLLHTIIAPLSATWDLLKR
jgi:hypothetical protein